MIEIVRSEPIAKMPVLSRAPVGSKELVGFRTRSVRVYEKDGQKFVVANKGFKIVG